MTAPRADGTGAVHLRPMRWWDVETAARLERRLFAADAWSAEAFWSELAQLDSRYYLVAVRDERVVGYGGLAAAGGEADVMTVAVDPDEQGRGTGRQLLAGLLAEADRRDCGDVHLEVRGGNAPAIALYERYGFARVGVRRGYYADGADALVMRRRLVMRRPPHHDHEDSSVP